jgi:hypothetical protein
MDLSSAAVAEIEAHLTPLFQGYRVLAPKIAPGTYIYRARKCNKPVLLKDLSYPPPQSVVRRGRANDIGEAVFYGATAREVPFYEIGLKQGDFVALSCWKVTDAILVNHVGYSSDAFPMAIRAIDGCYPFVESTRRCSDLNSLVHDYLAFAFSQPVESGREQLYALTLAISRKLFGKRRMLGGIMYPAVAVCGNADNIVLRKEVADDSLRFLSVEFALVKSTGRDEINIEVMDSATRTDLLGTIEWSGRGLEWQLNPGEQLELIGEGGRWVAHNSLGKRVDPQ